MDETPLSGLSRQRFGVRLWLRMAVALGLCLWLAAAAWLVVAASWGHAEMAVNTFVSLVFFNFLFASILFYYQKKGIIVDQDGVIVVGALSFCSYPWQDIVRIEAEPGFVPGYQVLTRRGAFGFSKLEIADHQRLHDIIERWQQRPARNAEAPRPQWEERPQTDARRKQRRERRQQHRHRRGGPGTS